MSTALYRRYRPETFAEVIGQDHVTGPLMQALRTGRITHAYLFSGPRGCGKTTSARILARTLNCARNTPEVPLDIPCGECPSCVELARGGSGSLDVVEIDAASHGGVDDARDLRERATFAPTRDRYKIFIIDEAHMVSPAGFNALLKIVEEPPPHIKFIFATTEPDKVIGTIRSRTHHYPFRLVPPDVLGPYLEGLCTAEGVTIGAGVIPLVTRSGGGSVRDSLSVLDQLIAGAEGGAVDYERAVALLGFTGANLLDDVVDALAARDGASIFRVVDHVIGSGHEPRRFVEDVLERLRDLIVMAVSGDAAEAVLRGQPADQLARMHAQASNLGLAELSRAADLANAALTEMAGATSPRLHLELLCARLLLPGADDGAAGFAARLDRLERGGLVAAPGAGVAAPQSMPVSSVPASIDAPVGVASTGGLTGAAAARAAIQAARVPVAPAETEPPEPQKAALPAPAPVPAPTPAPQPTPQPPAPQGAENGSVATEDVRHRWEEILDTLRTSRVTWSLVKDNAQVAELAGDTLVLAFSSDNLARVFSTSRHIDAVQDAVYQTIGLRVRVEARSGPVSPGGPTTPVSPPPTSPPPALRPSPGAETADAADVAWLAGRPLSEPPADLDEPPEPEPAPAEYSPAPAPVPAVSPAPVGETPRQAAERRAAERHTPSPTRTAPESDPFDEPSADDPDLASASLVGVPLVVKTLQGTVIEERIET